METETKPREKFKLPVEDAVDVINDDHPDYSLRQEKELSRARWAIIYRAVVKRKADDKFFETTFRRGVGDEAECPWQDQDEVEFTEVFPETHSVTVYV